MTMLEEDELTDVIKTIESMLDSNQANREKLEEAVLKIAYPLPPET